MVLVQVASSKATSATTLTVTLGAAAALGNCLVVCIACDASSARTVSGIQVGGSAGNFAQAKDQALASYTDSYCAIWTDQNIGTSSTSVVITMTGATTNLSAYVMEWSGIARTAAVDKTNSGTGTSSFSSGASGTLTNTNEVIIGATCCLAESGTSAITGPGAPWTNLTLVTEGDTGLLVSYQSVTANTTQTYSGTCSGGAVQESAAVIISLFEAAATIPNKLYQVNQSVMRAAVW